MALNLTDDEKDILTIEVELEHPTSNGERTTIYTVHVESSTARNPTRRLRHMWKFLNRVCFATRFRYIEMDSVRGVWHDRPNSMTTESRHNLEIDMGDRQKPPRVYVVVTLSLTPRSDDPEAAGPLAQHFALRQFILQNYQTARRWRQCWPNDAPGVCRMEPWEYVAI